MRLFENNQVSVYLREIEETIKEDVTNIPDQDILSLDLNDFINYYYDKYYIEPITILKNKISSSIEKNKNKEI